MRTRRKRIARIGLALLAPILLLAAVEGLLRLFGYGYPTAFFLEQRLEGRTVCTDNPKFGWRFFPRALARKSRPLQFAAEKPPGACRLFVLGGSAAMGDPEPSFGFARMLAKLLQARYPGVRFEVLNAAMTAVNSHVVLPIAEACAERQPDLFVVFMGNNEVVGPFGCGTIFGSFSRSRGLIRAAILARRTRIGQLLARLGRGRAEDSVPSTWGGMEMFLAHRVREDSPQLQIAYRHFRANLAAIVRCAEKGGGRVLLCTVPANIGDCAPFASVRNPDLDIAEREHWDQLYAIGQASAAAAGTGGDLTGARAAFRQAAAIDSGHAELRFRLARCEEPCGDHAEARVHYVRARDLDVLRFRADSRINEIVRETAATCAAQLVDLAAVFEQAATNGIPRDDLFLDHVHMNARGNYRVAVTLLQAIGRALPQLAGNADAEGRVLTEAQCLARLAFTAWHRHRLANEMLTRELRPPFTAQFDHEARAAARRRELAALRPYAGGAAVRHAIEAYDTALRYDPDDWVLHSGRAQLLQDFGAFDQAAASWMLAAARMPTNLDALNGLGLALARQGRLDEAELHYSRALRIHPYYTKAYNNLGLAMLARGRPETAVLHFSNALRIDARMAEAHYNLGLALGTMKRTADALAHFSEALAAEPERPDVHFNIGVALMGLGETANALYHFSETVRIDPGFFQAHINLGRAFEQQRNAEAALQHYSEALRLRPALLQVANRMAWIYATHPDPAVRNGAEAVRLAEPVAEKIGDRQFQALDTLAAAYAAAGRLEDAVRTARRALDAARHVGDAGAATRIESRLRVYETGKSLDESGQK
ncbi:MAG: tetratricopeptide repeat protein [Kiritimatiellae bacterium]|nr:tetratricopeptide repeat protein [Kiritimatiellia bacterium]